MKKPPWRKNVLTLVGMGYGAVLVIFIALVFAVGKDTMSAFDIIAPPLMALVGGSIAISKDVVNLDRDSEQPDQNTTNDNGEKTDKGSTDEQ